MGFSMTTSTCSDTLFFLPLLAITSKLIHSAKSVKHLSLIGRELPVGFFFQVCSVL